MPSRKDFYVGKHVFITGGSEGTGLELGRLAAQRGAKVTLVARTLAKLEVARTSISASCAPSACSVVICTADVTQRPQVDAAVASAEQQHGPVDVLICCAGASTPGYFHTLPDEVFEADMRLNYFGTLHPTRAVAPGMLRRNSGHVCFVASALALLGFVGYSSYCPSKAAVRALAEVLRNEFQGTGVGVTIAFPPDIDTPGYAHENLTKPPETHILSEGKLYPPQVVARHILDSVAAGDYAATNPNLEVVALQAAMASTQRRRLPLLLFEWALGCVKPFVWLAFTAHFDGVARRGARQRYAALWSGGGDAAGAERQPDAPGAGGGARPQEAA